MYLPRLVTARLRKMVKHFPAVVVTGARQVGKSTLLKHVFGDDYDYIQFDPYVDIENSRTDPDLFLRNHPGRLILDEIQYAPEIAASIKRKIDEDRSPGKYLISGSQQWSVMKGLSDSLAGRVVFVDLDQFTLSEILDSDAEPWVVRWLDRPDEPPRARIRDDVPLAERLYRGFYPEAQFLTLDLVPDFFRAYERTYIDRDIRQMADFADINLFMRFFRLLGALTAREVNHTQLGRDIGITPQTAQRWSGLLRATFQWHEIPAYTGNAVKRVGAKPKGYLGDTGLAAFSQAMTSPRALPANPLWGPLFETCVVNDIRKQLAAAGCAAQLYHWRSYGGAEVDLVLDVDGRLYPIEIKATTTPRKNDARGIAAFRDTYPHADIGPGLILCAAESTYTITENCFVLPWDVSYEEVRATKEPKSPGM